MARGVNKVILIGNLGNDPEIRYTASGGAVANVSLATSESWKDKQTGELNERTEWHRVIFFNRVAEIVGEYCKKGSKIYTEGRLQTRKWTDKDGLERYTTEIVANELQLLDSRGAGAGDQSAESSNISRNNNNNNTNNYLNKKNDYQNREQNTKPANQQQHLPNYNDNSPPPFDDDDIPF